VDIEQKDQRKRTNQEKIVVCEKYQDYLKIIDGFGNKVMLMKQLEEFAKVLDLAPGHSTFIHHMKALLEADIIKTDPFFINNRKTQHKIIILKKFALRYLKDEVGAGGSQRVAPVPPVSNDRILLSIFKSSLILQRFVPMIQKLNGKVELQNIFNLIEARRMSVLFEKNKGLDYAKWFRDEFNEYLNNEINYQIERLEAVHVKRTSGLKQGSKTSEGKGKAVIDRSGAKEGQKAITSEQLYKELSKVQKKAEEISPKEQKIAGFSFESMIRANTHIIQVSKKTKDFANTGIMLPHSLHVQALLFDYRDTQDLYTISKQIACLYQMLNDLMGRVHPENMIEQDIELYLKIGVVAFSPLSRKNLENKANEKIYSRFNDDENTRLKISLKNWGIGYDQFEQFIDVKFTDFDTENIYLEGKKYANLQKGKPLEQPKNT
jgi:hypothetical protein